MLLLYSTRRHVDAATLSHGDAPASASHPAELVKLPTEPSYDGNRVLVTFFIHSVKRALRVNVTIVAAAARAVRQLHSASTSALGGTGQSRGR
jgi:hypothetical protein